MYGAQTKMKTNQIYSMFENDVEMYGAQTPPVETPQETAFENDVEMYGAQTSSHVAKVGALV